MPIDVAKIGLAVQGGLSPVCATCKKYWEARERGIPGDACLARKGCSGPISGGDFHEYDGPISDLSRWCFICTQTAKFGIQVNGSPRVIGVCEEHVRRLADLRPVNSTGLQPKFVIKSKNGSLTIREILGTPKKSLFKAIADADAHFAEKDGSAAREREAVEIAAEEAAKREGDDND